MGVKLDIRGVKIGEANFRASLQREKGRGGEGGQVRCVGAVRGDPTGEKRATA